MINDIKISENFRLSEFASRDTGEVIIHPELIKLVQRTRDIIGLPIRINSGYRTPERNREVGGVKNSLHCQGKAVDISCAFCSLALLLVSAIVAGFRHIIVYSGYSFLHCDLSDKHQFLVPTDWVGWLSVIFPEYRSLIKPWAETTGVSDIDT